MRPVSINIKKILSELQGEPGLKRGSVTLYLDKELFKKFQEAMKEKGLSASTCIEKLMQEALNELEKK